MIKKWEMINSPRSDDTERYKVLVEGEHDTILKTVKKINYIYDKALCGRPFGQREENYNWAFYIYKSEEKEREQIKELLIKVKDSGEEALIIEKAVDANVSLEKIDSNIVVEEKPEIPSGVYLNKRFVFDNFVVAQNNHFAQAASLAVAESPGKVYNPLFIYGKVGLGKTHLMEAIGHYVLEHNSDAKVLYTTTEKFMAEVIEAIRHGKIMELRNRYRNLDLLLVDDIQFLSEAEAAQEEFFHTFNALYDAHKQIVITSDKPPKKIPVLEERLRSRFEWGLIVDLQVPNLETRVAILQKKAQMVNLSIPNEILRYIADKFYSNIRELEGFLIRISAYATLINRELNKELAEELIKDLLPSEEEEAVPPVEFKFVSTGESEDISKESKEKVKQPEVKEEATKEPVAKAEKPQEIKEEVKQAEVEEEATKESVVEAEKPQEVKEEVSVDMSLKCIKIGYLYPEQKEADLKMMKEMFDTTLKKHKIKFRLEIVFEKSYQAIENANFQDLVGISKEKQIDVAIGLGPASGSVAFKENFSHSLVSSFEKEKISVQIIPFNDISKQYRYLDICLDLAFLKK